MRKEWVEKIVELWGFFPVSLSRNELSLDEHLSRAWKLESGSDPYEESRLGVVAEGVYNISHPSGRIDIRDSDKYYFNLLNSGLINHAPEDREQVLELMATSPLLRKLNGAFS